MVLLLKLSLTIFLILVSSEGRQDDDSISPLDPLKNMARMNLADPDYGLTTPELIDSRGFRSETHRVTTDDGYVLTLFRITNPLRSGFDLGHPVLLMHGLFGLSDNFLNGSPGGYASGNFDLSRLENGSVTNNLGFALAQFGFDVWLGNVRGNTYSREHIKLNPDKDSKYWEFSFDEMVKYDLPATIECILRVTKQKSLHYIGHSQGSIIMFGLLADRPEYGEKLDLFVSLGSVINFKNPSLLLRSMKSFATPLKMFFQHPSSFEMLSSRHTHAGRFLSDYCLLAPESCYAVIPVILGDSYPSLNKTRIPTLMSTLPAGSSSRNLAHYVQNLHKSQFARFDPLYLPGLPNLANHQLDEMKFYNVKKVNASRIVIFSADKDIFTHDTENDLIKSLPGEVLQHIRIKDTDFGHLSYVASIKAGELVNKPILKLFREYYGHRSKDK